MVYQETVFRGIQTEIMLLGREKATHKVAGYMEQLYALDLEGEIYFYEQDVDGLPIGRVQTKIGDEEPFYSTLLIRNILDASAWEQVGLPSNFEGGIWPPCTRADLLGCKTMNELCAECDPEDTHNDSNCDDVYFSWIERRLDLWFKNFDIRLAEYTGYGLYARNKIPCRWILGEYTGIMLPIDKSLTNDQTVYQFGINIGKLQSVTKFGPTQPMCWVDATRKGSVFRFMAHSCNPNAVVVEARCGLHNRILSVRTLRDILPGEEITINYGSEWFSTSEQPCYCGTRNCKNPPRNWH
jgi:hypothetical protein